MTLEGIRVYGADVSTWQTDDFRIVIGPEQRDLTYPCVLTDMTTDTVIFSESFLLKPPVDDDNAFRFLLNVWTLRPGDIEEEFFDSYTPEQIEWRDSRAEDLASRYLA